jgi:hypothetical protein
MVDQTQPLAVQDLQFIADAVDVERQVAQSIAHPSLIHR